MNKEESLRVLAAIVTAGAAPCAEKLSQATRGSWSVASVVMSTDEAGAFAAEHASLSGDHYGCRFTFPGGSFLVLFSSKSGFLIASAFTRDHEDSVESMAKRESVVLGEVANILLNPLIAHLGDALNLPFLISAPQTQISSPRDHLTRALELYRNGDSLAAAVFITMTSKKPSNECRVMLFLDKAMVDGIA